MSQIQASSSVQNLADEEFKRWVDVFFQEVVRVVNGKLGPDNFSGKIISASFPAANTDATFSHGLGRVPSVYIQTSASTPMSIYAGSIATTKDTITLKSSAVGSAGLWIF